MLTEPSTKVCAWCGKEFQRTWQKKPSAWKAARHCSISCGRKAAETRKPPAPRYCEVCGKQLARYTKTMRCAEHVHGTLRERFEAKVEKTDDCWLWAAAKLPSGYGQIRANGRADLAHRISYELHIGPIPVGMHLDHLCRNRSCVNPAHLEPVTHAENVRRGLHVALKKTCANGHPWVPENIAPNGRSGARCCAICHRERVKAAYSREGIAKEVA